MTPARILTLIGIALVTQAATITITNETLPRSAPKPGTARPAPAQDATAKAWLAAINRQRAQKGLSALDYDPVLGDAARRQAEYILRLPEAQRQSVSARKLLEVFWQAGATDGNPTWRVFNQDAASPPGPWGSWRLGTQLESDASHIGIGSLEREGVRWTVIVIVKRRVEIAGNLTGLRHPYERLYLRGRLRQGFVKPHLMVTRPDGKVQEFALAGSGDSFEHLVELDGVKGRYMIEIMVDSRTGPAVATLFPIDVGMAYRPENRAEADDSKLSLAERRQRMLALINADRKRFDLPPVVLNDHFSRMAQGHSEDMKRHGFFAHTSPTTGSLENRAKAAGIPPMTMGENIAVAATLAEAEEGLMGSPAHRSMILDPQMTVVGIGIVSSDPGERGPVRYWVTQNYGVRAPQ